MPLDAAEAFLSIFGFNRHYLGLIKRNNMVGRDLSAA
jgi:hypothetical protein